LTLFRVSSGTTSKFKKGHDEQVLKIAKLDTVVFVASMIVFQLMNIPITEAENVEPNWYSTIYYVSLGLASILSGALISVVLLLYNAVANIILIVGLEKKDHPLVDADEETKKKYQDEKQKENS
ncbi:MAG: hypothetical protein R3213_00825, partial [Flavobacteriaceae bacterium]|nr:hypothetical protein [Flavobacteriaceae bacterium]